MKEVVKFAYEKCEAEYECQSSAEDCESAHIPASRIDDARFAAATFGSYPYPEWLLVKTSNERSIWYRFAKVKE